MTAERFVEKREYDIRVQKIGSNLRAYHTSSLIIIITFIDDTYIFRNLLFIFRSFSSSFPSSLFPSITSKKLLYSNRRYKRVNANWKGNVGSSLLEEIPVTDTFRLWAEECGKVFDMDILTVCPSPHLSLSHSLTHSLFIPLYLYQFIFTFVIRLEIMPGST